MDDWSTIRYLSRSEGLSGRRIASRLRVSRNTVARALASDGPPGYKTRPPVESAWSRVEPRVRALLAEYPEMPATVVAERVGWSGSVSWLRENVSGLRPECRKVDPADRLAHLPGEEVQCDLWTPPVDIPVGGGQAARLPVLVMVASFARFVAGVMIPSKRTGDLLAGMWLLLDRDVQAVPKRLLWDNETGIGRRGRLASGVAGWSGTLGTRIKQAKPYDPETKGIVERANEYLETSFLPGRVFVSPEDFNRQIVDWLAGHGNRRLVRSTGLRPVDAIDEDRSAMMTLPPIPPLSGDRFQVRLGRDYYVRAGANDYSVDPSVIDRLVDVQVGLDEITVTCQGRLVASHRRRWGRRLTVTDPAHVAAAARLRAEFQRPKPVPADDDLACDLAVYDAAFGVAADLAAEWRPTQEPAVA
ncbi:MAG: IS21 family transposase [Propionibacteriaceae bacterium]|nr:IS21 family transposase [Propionibacteriaceae bacterium]